MLALILLHCASHCVLTSALVAAARPNILLLFPDQWRYDWDGFSRPNQPDAPGSLLHLPNTRSVADRGTRFTTAYVPAPVCAPSRSCLAAGREYDQTGVPSNSFDYPQNQSTFYQQLRSSGYHVMTTGKDDLTKKSQLGSRTGYPGCPTCLAGDGRYRQQELGFSDALRYSGKEDVVDLSSPHEMYGYYLRNHTVKFSRSNKTTSNITGWEAHKACLQKGPIAECMNSTFTKELYEDDFTANNAIRLLQRAPTAKPWFLHVSFPGPHSPFLVTAAMRNAASDGRNWPNATDDPNGVTRGGVCNVVTMPTVVPNQHQERRCNYAAEIENLDRLFGLVLNEVKNRQEMNNTIVCIASDHGEMLGDHGDISKSKPWEGSAHVPLMCAGPGILHNHTVTRPVATMDMSGTFIDYANAELSLGMTTVSFRSLLEKKDITSTNYRTFISSGLSNFRMVVWENPADQRQWKYICCKGKCPGSPSTAPTPKKINGFVEMLIDIVKDPYDMNDVSMENQQIVHLLRTWLPDAYAKGCSEL